MRLAFRISLLAIRLASLLGAGAALAGTLVEFPNLPGQQPTHLTGYLARPDTGLAAELSGDGRGMKMSSRGRGRATAVGSEKRPSLGRAPTGKTRRFPPFADS